MWNLISQRIENGKYIFKNHAKKRLIDRKITDLDVINILENKKNRKRNKIKDKYLSGHADWNYCIEGTDTDERKIRIIVSFGSGFLLVITVIRLRN